MCSRSRNASNSAGEENEWIGRSVGRAFGGMAGRREELKLLASRRDRREISAACKTRSLKT